MSDDKTNRGAADRNRINIHEEYEVRDWSQRLGVSSEELKKAVQQVGTSADAVRKHLGK
jgi:AraC-like DNA-binding protein